jgi:hypothetical protein
MTTFTIYLLLFIATALYAALLALFRHLWEPKLTWLEVAIGTAIVLAAPALDARWNGPLIAEIYELRVWAAFLVGGAPIVVWQIVKDVRAGNQAEREMRELGSGDTSDRATRVVTDRESGAAPRNRAG